MPREVDGETSDQVDAAAYAAQHVGGLGADEPIDGQLVLDMLRIGRESTLGYRRPASFWSPN